jgi:hypothetical protein
VRNPPFTWFPLELSIRQVPGYETQNFGGVKIQGRRDVFLAQGEDWWLRGNSAAEIWMSSATPIPRAVFRVRSPAPDNDVDVEFAGHRETATFHGGAPGEAMLTFTPEAPDRLRSQDGQPVYAYRLSVKPHRGQNAEWTRVFRPTSVPASPTTRASRTTSSSAPRCSTSAAARGSTPTCSISNGERPRCPSAPHLASGCISGRALEPERGAVEPRRQEQRRREREARLSLAATRRFHGRVGRPAHADRRGAAGGRVTATLTVDVPRTPGSYVLALDPLFEHVAWFSERGVPELRGPVEVAIGDPAARAAAPP